MPRHAGEPGAIGSIGGYELVDRLGSGGMGVVYLARSVSGRQLAVKVVHAQYALDEEFRARFRQEIAAARRVSGAFTAPVVDADPDAELPWMATSYVPGRTLSEMVDREGPLGGRELRALALGLVEALRDIHQAGVVHRDLKPSNVLMAGDGPRVIDFGISRAADSQALTVTGRLIGTPPFMSPEQFASPRDVTAASDVFSLGSLLVFAATGNGPFDGGSPYVTGYQVMNEPPSLDGVPQPLRGIIERCLDKDPATRPQLAELQGLFGSLPNTAAPAGPGVAHLPSVPGNGNVPRGPAATTTADTTTADAPTAGTTATGGAAGRGRRVRRLLVLGAVLAVTAAAVPVYHLVSSPDTTEGGHGDRASGAGASASPALPAGWRPWRTDLTRAVKNESLATNVDSVDSGCVSGGTSLYCAGTGFTVARIDAASGRVKWRFGSNSQAAARPLGVRDGIVYTHVQPNEDSVYSTQELVGVDTDSGKRVWTRTIDAGHPAVLFDGGILAMSGEGEEFVALDPKTGEDLWRTPAKSSAGTACAPTVLGGAPYGICVNQDDPFKGDAGFLRLAPADGTARELAELPLLAEPLGAVGGQPLFALRQSEESQSDNGRDEPYRALLQVNPDNGDVVRIPLKGTPRGLPGLVGTAVYFVRPDGTVTATRADDGARLWQKVTQIENLSAPVLSTKYDHLYFANRYGRLLALDRRTGTVQWTTNKLTDPGTSAENRIPSTLLVKDALVAVAGDTAFSTSPDRAP
ncbi:protein kinase domain-containing protein [Streptomyces phaeochromogenes]|uniref:protein kinase domain-containing protein n=1 Tax=Streptomyces phaeochromogenes TaxID=1923 RepID=UPI002DDA157D|nr:PQQ-binding-like beta-propeller repeat protein [Streptomyces phaeochromogenes]WRZ30305.1 PQQ-binding-like beta-propeller repeat protein [Streptomyces phaeochromogenes]